MAEKLEFRALRADEVEARVGTISEKGCSLLLYKDARCDMNILDEVVGPMNWKREHSNGNANCTVSIYNDKTGQWIAKEDTGIESFSQKEKGLASDSFKRACVNWGIGRELYTSPFIWFSAGEVNILVDKDGKKRTYDRFSVTEMEVVGGRIKKVTVVNETTKTTKSFYGKNISTTVSKPAATTAKSAQTKTAAKSAASKPAPATAKTPTKSAAPSVQTPSVQTPNVQTSSVADLGSYRITTDCSRKGMTLDELFAANEQTFLKRVVQCATPERPAMQADASYVKPFLESKGVSLAS